MILDKELELFEEWSKVRKGFSPDGVANEEEYLKSNIKLLFILKEVNDKKREGVDMKDFLYHGAYGRPQTWENITRWIFGIKNIERHINWKEIEHRKFFNENRNHLLPTISAINLKKSPGGHTTNPIELIQIANEDKVFLNSQFKLYFDNSKVCPDIIIACGVSDIFHGFVKMDIGQWKITSRGVYYYEFKKGRYFIKYSHPEARVADNILYYPLVDSIREILNIEIIPNPS